MWISACRPSAKRKLPVSPRGNYLQLVFGDGASGDDGPSAVEFDPARLTQARHIAGMTKREVALKVGLTAAAIGQYETGAISKPNRSVVQNLAALFDVPEAFFAPGRPYTKLDPSMAHFRKLRSTRVGQQNQAVACAEQVWELSHALERRVRLPLVDIPGFSEGETQPDREFPSDPRLAARVLRQHWQLGDGPVSHLVRLLESKGVIATMLPLDDAKAVTIDAFSIGRLQRPLVLLTRDRASDVYRYRFTVAHELGHLVLHGDHASGDQAREREADIFAAEFLTPHDSIISELPSRVDFATLARLQDIWGVSVKSLIYRSREVGLISAASASRAYQRLHQLQEEVPAFQPSPTSGFSGELPVLLRRAFELIQQNGTTLRDLARELVWRPTRVSTLLEVPDPRPILSIVT